MEVYRPWLPGAAIEACARAVPLRQVVADWSAKWFVRPPVTPLRDAVLTAVADPRGGARWVLADGVGLRLAAEGEQGIMTLLFGARDGAEPLMPGDTLALQAVVDSCLRDLRARLATALRLPEDAPWRPEASVPDAARRWVWRIEAGRGAALLEIAVDEALLVRRIRAGLPPAPAPQRISRLAAALAPQPIVLSALVGRCRLTTAELAGLGEGDVVVLDRALDDPVAIAVDRVPQARACTVAERDGQLHLTLVD